MCEATGVVGLCAVEGSPINIKDVMNDDRYSARNDRHGFTDGKSKAMLAIPIGQTPQVVGWWAVGWLCVASHSISLNILCILCQPQHFVYSMSA